MALWVPCMARAQGCQAQLHQAAVQSARATVSASALRIPPKAWDHFEKARRASETGHPEVLEREAALALVAAPDFTEVYILQAAMQVQTHQFETAIATVTKARQIQPEVLWSGIVLAGALTGLHRYDDAAGELARSHGAEAASWQWAFERTRAEIGRGNVRGALLYSELALSAAPAACTETHLLRANAFQIAGRGADAIPELEAYLTSAPQGPTRAEVLRVLESTRRKLPEGNTSLLAAN